MKSRGKENRSFLINLLIIISATLSIFFLLFKEVSLHHLLGLLFILISEIIFVRGIIKTAIVKEKENRPTGEIYGIFTINQLIMIFVSIIYILEEGESVFIFIIIELFLMITGLMLLNSMLTVDSNSVNKKTNQ